MTKFELLAGEQETFATKLTGAQKEKLETLTEAQVEELKTFAQYATLLATVNENLLTIRAAELELKEEDKTLRDEDWAVLNLYHDNEFDIASISIKGEELSFHVKADFEIEDDETKEKEKVKAEIAVIYNYITNTVEDIDSWLNFKNSDKYKDAAVYNNVLVG